MEEKISFAIENWQCPKCFRTYRGIYSVCFYCVKPKQTKKKKQKIKWCIDRNHYEW